MRIKICGITKVAQGVEIARLGATALGFICVERSPRYVTPTQIQAITTKLSASIDAIGVFADHDLPLIIDVVSKSGLTGIQLHGSETPQFCQQLKQQLPQEIEIIKAFRVKTSESLSATKAYDQVVDSLLLDAYHPQMLGGTGHTLDWQDLQKFSPKQPWFLAGGLNPENIREALSQLRPDGIDLSSGVERSPGDKDLIKVEQLFEQLRLIETEKN